MIVWIVISAVVVASLVAAWLYDRLHPGAGINRGILDLDSDLAMARRDALSKGGVADREHYPSGSDPS